MPTIDLDKLFPLSEFRSRNDNIAYPGEWVESKLNPLRRVLYTIWIAVGGHDGDLVFTSGYRSPANNAAVGGHPNSFHLQGKAVDFYSERISTPALYQLILGLISSGKIPDGGVGLYLRKDHHKGGFVHYDSGPANRRWEG